MSADPIDELPSTYDPSATERALTEAWQAAGLFTAQPARSRHAGGDRPPFTVVIPPPNVTAVLHVGHGLNNTVQDVVVRWRRMAGDEALWVPGTDHAGIATQNVVEKLLARDGQTRFDLGREAFVARTAQFVEETGGQILQQLRGIGASADWTRTAYTLSPALSHAVRTAFVRLFKDGKIYRGHRIIHWCPRCLTSLSDEEAEFHEADGRLWHIRYPLTDDPSRWVTVATTRPETLLGDVAVAVHPDDERYRDLVGRTVRLPLNGVAIPVIADAFVEREFGTGVVKVTPAHDANDFEAWKRVDAAGARPVVIDAEGRMAEGDAAAGRIPAALHGVDRFEARKRIHKALEAAGALEKVEQHRHSVRRCYRCDTVVEPRLSWQWFVRMAELAQPALAAVRDGRLRILPDRWEAVYVNWMEGIRDWNISRQIWWGHRIPVWSCDDPACAHVDAYLEDPAPACPACGRGRLVQDADVLDTWFSSWLWPLTTLGWPDADARDLKAFYPTDVLVTAPEILFFWVARMVMAGMYFDGRDGQPGRPPFHTVYLHGTVRDMQHRKMSKSLGNGIDPLEVVDRYGADALRWTLVAGLGMGVDVMLDPADLEKSFAPGRNFCTKLWNIGRFNLLQVGPEPVLAVDALDPAELRSTDRWILTRLARAVEECDAALGPARPDGRWQAAQRAAGLRLSEYAETARRFVWSELADWYVEAVKPRLAEPGRDREVARAVLVHCFDQALRLLHPIIPFVTETLWQKLPGRAPGEWLAVAAWPTVGRAVDAGARPFQPVQEAITAIRQLRNEYLVPPSQEVEAVLVGPDALTDVVLEEAAMVFRMARCRLTAGTPPASAAATALLPGGAELFLPLAGLVDLDKERARLQGELQGLERQLAALQGRLSNEKFTAKAPPAVVEAERAKATEWSQRVAQLRGKLTALGAA